MRLRGRTTLAGAALAAAACASGGLGAGTTEPGAEFGSAARILDGFDPWEPDAAWRLGDKLLFGIAVQDGGERREWYALVRVAGRPGRAESFGELPATGRDVVVYGRLSTGRIRFAVPEPDGAVRVAESDGISIGVQLYDARGDLQSISSASAPEGPLRAGIAAACERGSRADALEVLFALLAGIHSTPDLEELRRAIAGTVLESPGFFSLVANLGVRVAGIPYVERAEPIGFRWGAETVAGVRFPATVDLNGERALDYVVEAVPSSGPARATAGIVAIAGRHPGDPSRRFHARLLASRRGTDAEQAEADAGERLHRDLLERLRAGEPPWKARGAAPGLPDATPPTSDP